ncbi:MAG TPA: right-handed parallel beta-helix repeat-containing protein [Thermoanaerobaculia bacterium]|nr:right-handed parallel beta-helix repeat-containing protein [Thermoanaerobaculia bacterium]
MRNLFFVLTTVLFASQASAQVARVFLSGTGNDLNDCSVQSTPCRSLQGAHDQVSPSGEVIILTSGGFGTATITKSITIDAPNGVVAFNGRTINVNIAASDVVVLRGISMNGTIFADPVGVAFTTAGTLIIENSVISGFGKGIAMTGAAGHLAIVNSDIRNNANYGLQVNVGAGSDALVTVEHSRFEKNGTQGISVQGNAVAVIRDSTSTNQTGGIGVDGNAGDGPLVVIERTILAQNGTGIEATAVGQSTAVAQVSATTLIDNGAAVSNTVGSFVQSWVNNRVGGTNPFTGTLVEQ